MTNKGLESLWLLTVVLVPLAFFSPNTVPLIAEIGEVELPKIVLLRTTVGLMAILWLIQWALQSRSPFGVFLINQRWHPARWPGLLGRWLASQLTRWLFVAVVVYLAVTLLSTVLSVSINASLLGTFPGTDAYSAYTVVAYVVLFGVIATRLKSQSQMWRLLGAVVVMGVLVGAYAMLQHYGHDIWGLQGSTFLTRANSTLGNPIFAASALLMSISVSLVLATATLADQKLTNKFWAKVGLWAPVLTVQLLGISFTFSRGPWVGTILALVSFFGLLGFLVGWRTLIRAGLVALVAVGLTSLVLLLSPQVIEGPSSAVAVTERFASVGGDVLSGAPSSRLSGRVEIWRNSWQLIQNRPWFEFDELSRSPLRPWVGYGPDLFRYAYLIESPPVGSQLLPDATRHGHNYLVHQWVELGILGVIASFGVLIAPLLIGGFYLLKGTRQFSALGKVILIGLMAALAGRFVEQLVGVARVADLTLFWVLLGAFAAWPAVFQANSESPGLAQQTRGSRQPRPPRSPAPEKPLPYNWGIYSSLVVVGLLVTGIGAITWAKSINYARAAPVYARGLEHFRAGDFGTALVNYERAIHLAPEVAFYHAELADVYSAYRNNYVIPPEKGCMLRDQNSYNVCLADQAYSKDLQGFDQRPFDFRTRSRLAVAALELALLKGDAELAKESIRFHRESVTMVPHSWPLRNKLALAYIRLGQPEQALPTIEGSLAITGDTAYSSEGFLLQGIAYQDLGQPMKALEALKQSISHDPENPNGYFERGSIYFNAGELDRAVEDFGETIDLDPSNATAYYNRGIAYHNLEQFGQAIQDYNEAIRLDRQYANAYYNRGLAYEKAGLLPQAIQDFTEVIRLKPQDPRAYVGRALGYALLGKNLEAEQDLEHAVELGVDRDWLEEELKKKTNQH